MADLRVCRLVMASLLWMLNEMDEAGDAEVEDEEQKLKDSKESFGKDADEVLAKSR